ncbi:MAG: glycosyltransferase, partial [Terracidiphilus sp.]
LYTFPVFAGYLMARIYHKPYGFWPHGVLSPFQRGISIRKKKIYNWLIANRILRDAAVMFYSSSGERAGTADLKLTQLSVVVPDGFSADEFKDLPERGRFRQRFLDGSTGPLVLFLARLHAVKGLDLLIQAMRLIIEERPDARLAIVGPSDPPSFKRKVQEWIKSAGIEKQTVLTGNADAQMRLEAFADADVYTLPSHSENFGFSVFEAMACGLPVVVSESISYAKIIAGSGAGFALPRTPEAFASAINSLIIDPACRSEMGTCGRVLASRYSLRETGIKVAGTIECIVRRTHPPSDVLPMYGAKAFANPSE